jgi:hypothetical protein
MNSSKINPTAEQYKNALYVLWYLARNANKNGSIVLRAFLLDDPRINLQKKFSK